jgi:hypothetical protein
LSIYDYDKEYVKYSQKCNITFDQEIMEKNGIPLWNVNPTFYREKFFFKISDIGDLTKFLRQYVETYVEKNGIDIKNFYQGDVYDKFMSTLKFYSNLMKSSADFYQKLQNCFNNIQYIGPLRHPADRSYERGSFDYVGAKGEHAVQILADNPNVKNDVEKYFEDMDIANTLNILSSANEKNFEFRIKTKITEDEVNFADIGFGTSQILPIIVQSSISNKESLIMIEQPELHLHPRVQASLADFFVKLAPKRQKFLLETHSDYLLERLRYNILDGNIRTEDVAIYYIEQSKAEKCSTITKIIINSRGQYSNLPDNYTTNFKLEETRKIAKKLLDTL